MNFTAGRKAAIWEVSSDGSLQVLGDFVHVFCCRSSFCRFNEAPKSGCQENPRLAPEKTRQEAF
jgi:hypothetical protein